VKNPKIKIRKRGNFWWVSIPGDIPDFSKHKHFTDALAKVQFEIRPRRKGKRESTND